ncbi:LuxR C-terminal-related transcriptional regulator [Salmonella enterica]|nr:hypothetical protein [Salmonella enterica]EDR1539094.1 hypothetical protein [Salmonella enterica subsp. enterica serovar Javiana]EGO3302107.1 hypothetical protein [Salmonella enterica]EHC5972872.1 hypothetical protein [Salmonella enterica]EIU9582017.1 hypothetical protein [Salmonella enterica]
MLYLLSSDIFLLNGLNCIFSHHPVTQLTEIKTLRQIRHDTVIIDCLFYPYRIQHCLLTLTGIPVKEIIFLCPFRIKGLKYTRPIYFIPRNINKDFFSPKVEIMHSISEVSLPVLTLTELTIISLYLSKYSDTAITEKLHISQGTLRVHKYQLMLKLRLKKMCHIIHTRFYPYFASIPVSQHEWECRIK